MVQRFRVQRFREERLKFKAWGLLNSELGMRNAEMERHGAY